MQLWQALVLGALQGVAELFPVSSLAQTILLPALLKWDLDQKNTDFLAFVVALHLATAVALVLFFWKDWLKVVQGLLGTIKHKKLVYDDNSKFAWLLIVGTLFVGVAGLLLEKYIRNLFDDPSKAWIVAAILVVNGFIMLFGDFMKRRAARRTPAAAEHTPDMAMHAALVGQPVRAATHAVAAETRTKVTEDLTFLQAFWIGAGQTLALLPGISRSGVTMVGGLQAGLPYEEAARFTFMLATPVIAAAALKKIPDLLKESRDIKMMALYGSVVAFVAAWLSVKFLTKYFHTNRLSPFGYFCIIFGLASAIYLKTQPQHDLAQDVRINRGSQVVHHNTPSSR